MDLKMRNQHMPDKVVMLLTSMSALMSVLLIISNLMALKVWNLYGIPVDAGILAFPLSYVIGDLLVEIYGEQMANRVAAQSAGFALLSIGLMALAGMLPDFPGADNEAFEIVQLATGRMFVASVLGFLFSQWANNYLFVRIRHQHEQTKSTFWLAERPFWAAFAKRALISSSVAHIVDSLTFETLAFYGKLPLREFACQAVFAYIAAFIIELAFFPLTFWLACKARQKLHYSDGCRLIENKRS